MQDKDRTPLCYVNEGIIERVGHGKVVLDVGCGTGNLGAALKQHGNHVYGIDVVDEYIEAAKQRLDGAYIFDIAGGDELPFRAEEFDVIICSNVLEHLAEPVEALKRLSPLLKAEGYIIISVPNIATWTMRLSLLFGRFEYSDQGVLDKTHLRFFTLKTLKQLISEAGLVLVKLEAVPNLSRSLVGPVKWLFAKYNSDKLATDEPPSTIIVRSGIYRLYQRWGYPLEVWLASGFKGLLAYQFIASAKK